MNSYYTTVGLHREETVEIVNKGTPEEDVVITGKYVFKADDGFKYTVEYTYDKDGRNVTVSRAPYRRIDPNALKSLVG